MKDRNRTRVSVPMSGASSMLVIFAVLCMTIFAILSLSTVLADSRLADASAAAVEDYYEADGKAEEVLAQLRGGIEPEDLELQVLENNAEEKVYYYHLPVGEKQELLVVVGVSGEDYHIYQWQTVSTVDWQNDESIKVWDGTWDKED